MKNKYKCPQFSKVSYNIILEENKNIEQKPMWTPDSQRVEKE